MAVTDRILKALLVGLLLAQTIASLQVWHTNREVLARAAAMSAEGYLTVPSAHIQAQLAQWTTALAGGLFFTLSIGAGLTVATLLLAIGDASIGGHRRGIPVLGLALQALMLLRLNLDGLQPLSSLYVLFVPLAVWVAFSRSTVAHQIALPHRRYLIPLLLPLVLLTFLWLPQKDEGLFIRIRDKLLLNTDVGQAVNDYYYRNTLAPAEVFKPLAQKTLKALARSDLLALPEGSRSRITQTLANWDYLPIENEDQADLRLHVVDGQLLLSDGRGIRHSAALNDFLKQPGDSLSAISQRIDAKAFFRSLTFYGLLFGFPLSLYLLLFCTLALVLRPLAGPRAGPWVAGACCLLLGAAAWWPVNAGRIALPKDQIEAALAAADMDRRLAALRVIHDQKLEIGQYPQYRSMLKKGSIAERYWLARALGASSSRAAYDELMGLTEDDHPNVRCQAYYALGRRGDRRAVPVIIAQLKASRHWYVQWYGYRSLKTLGWRQTPSL
jgi:ABC-type amino acid transport system permease subunit